MSPNTESPANVSPPTSPYGDLRPITSTTKLSPNSRVPSSKRNSLLVSPSSIPSSPTSIHSGSSAIFERDIEPITTTSQHHDPHRTARGHNSETLEQSVPSVLDSAAEILTSTSSAPTNVDEEEISIITPNPVHAPSSSTSPMSTSRSPSPYKSNRSPNLLNLPNLLPGGSSPKLAAFSLPPLLTAPMATAVPNNEPMNLVTPTAVDASTKTTGTPVSTYYSLESSSSSSPTTTTMDSHPLNSLPVPEKVPSPRLRQSTSGSSPSLMASKRLSFLSYTDLLASTPSSTLPLSSLTTSLNSNQPEPVSRSVFLEPEAAELDAERSFESVLHGGSLRGRSSVIVDDPINITGGEWQREGFGRGLEERLEMVGPAGV